MPPKKSRLKPGANQGQSQKKSPSTSGTSTPVPDSDKEQSTEEKKLTAQEIIGGKSWTGKLPQTLFYELCVKNGWRSEYGMKREPPGYLSTVHLRTTNPKTQIVELISYRPPTELPNGLPVTPSPYQPTALEARHYAATYALHRVSSHRNIHLMLPPAYRSHWNIFGEIKKEWVARNRAWMYEADPFVTKREHEAAIAKSARIAAAGGSSEGSGRAGAGATAGSSTESEKKEKSWINVPTIEMTLPNRRHIEHLMRRHHTWNPSNTPMPQSLQSEATAKLTELGFRASHAAEACTFTSTREEALAWLLVHVPEDDLPERFLPGNYAAGVSVNTGEVPIAIDYAAKRLSAGGYSLDLCREVLMDVGGDEGVAARVLMEVLLHGEKQDWDKERRPGEEEEEDLISFDDPVVDSWAEEGTSLEAIWGERYNRISSTQYLIRLDLPSHTSSVITLDLRKPPMKGLINYPHAIPTIFLHEDPPILPAHVKLSLIRQTASFAESLRGDAMGFSLVDFVESNFATIVANPGRLRDVAGAVSAGETTTTPAQKPNKTRGSGKRRRPPIDWTPGTPTSLRMLEARAERWSTQAQIQAIEARKRLPAWNLQEDIIDAVDVAQVTIISGETGSGKSTQAVQFILDDLILRRLGAAANIICTQPRRISALGLAERVAAERCGKVGDEVGYAIRGESRQRGGVTRITFVTTGVLLRRLQMGDSLEDVSHVVVDEVHERSLDTDFLLILLKRMLAVRTDLRVILMSATLDAEVFSEYFGGAEKVRHVQISGRTFPVSDFYLDQVISKTRFDGGRLAATAAAAGKSVDPEDLRGVDPGVGSVIRGLGDRINYNLIAATVAHIDEELGDDEGAILIFLPGAMEIQRCLDAIRFLPSGPHRFHPIALHSSLLPSEQRRVFAPPPPMKRKLIAATNIAETSITIDDVIAVIDTGRVKETSYDAGNNILKLLETWASKAACKQRRGRAGRTAPGVCYKLFTRNAEERMPDRPPPELLRVPLEQTCLAVKQMGVRDIRAFLASAISPPATMAVDSALLLLGRMGALTTTGELTALGKHMAVIPADLRCGKLMVYGALFGALDAAVAVASILTARSPIASPSEHREAAKAARMAFAPDQGDLVADLRAFETWGEMRGVLGIRELRAWCADNFVSHQTCMDILSNARQYIDALKEIGFVQGSYSLYSSGSYNRYGRNDALLRGLIAGAFAPGVACVVMPETRFANSAVGAVALDHEAKQVKFYAEGEGRVFIHPGSTMFAATAFGRDAFVSYCTKIDTGVGEKEGGKIFLRECTPVNAYSLLLFCGSLEVDTMGRGITVDGWIRLRGWGRIGTLVAGLRGMLDGVLEEKVTEPGMDLDAVGIQVVECVSRLIEGNGL